MHISVPLTRYCRLTRTPAIAHIHNTAPGHVTNATAMRKTERDEREIRADSRGRREVSAKKK